MSSQRDFKPRDKKAKARRHGPPLWIWLLTATLLALLVGGLVYLSKTARQTHQPVANPVPPAETPAPVGNEEEPTPPASRFQFYDILPNMEVTVPEPADDEQAVAPKDRPVYFLQAGSFHTHEQADARKAQLALLGLESSIQKVEVNGRTQHRVRIGPFESRRKADVALRRIRDSGGDALLLRR